MEALLTTKLFIPSTRPELVPRPHLNEQLNEGLHRKLTLISAPAGFGKTTLVTEWLDNLRLGVKNQTQTENKIAWLSLDDGDNDPVRFLTYFITALNQIEGIESTFGKGALSMLQSPQPSLPEAALTSLINDIATITYKVILILDDFHLIEVQPIYDALTFLLEHLPPQMHLIIATREDPHLPLARLRAQDQLAELRASDLRFTSSEIAEFLNQTMGLDLSKEDILALETRTEGWIAGLQLAAISLQGQDDPASQIASFTGNHRFVLDYLVEEVLLQQPESIQSFLLQTAVLDKMTSSLCNALTDQDNGQEILEMLERANLFITHMDEERCCFRYHHLFADLLRQRLRQTHPDQLPILNLQASEWYEKNGFVDEAIDYSLRAKDFLRAADLLEEHIDAMWQCGEHAKMRRWLEEIPDEIVLSTPLLCIFRAWEFFSSGQQDAAERFLKATELKHGPITNKAIGAESRNLDNQPASESLRMRGKAEAILAWMAAYRSDVPEIIKHSSQALKFLPEQDLHWRSATAITLGDAYCIRGEYNAAYKARLDAVEASKASGNIYLFMNASMKLAIALKARGELQKVIEICKQRLQLANEKGLSQAEVVGWLLAIWGEVLAEQNDLDGALDQAIKGVSLTERGGDMVMLSWSYICLTRVLYSKGDLSGAEAITKKMESVAQDSTIPQFLANLNTAWQSRIWLAQGKMEDVSQWLLKCNLNPENEPDYVDGFLYIALARILITQGKWDKTITFLPRMLDVAEACGDTTRMIEITVLLALAYQVGSKIDQAKNTLERALLLAEPKGFLRIFIDEGPPLARLLYEARSQEIAPVYVSRLLAEIPITEQGHNDPTQSHPPDSRYIEPLSNRELEVLQLIAEGLTNQEIASRLFLSLNTIKVHTRNIYGKLGVNNRTQAAARSKDLGILLSN